MAQESFSETVANAAKAAQILLQAMAVSKVRDIANKCSNFKIGKTGESIEERYNQSDYKNKYKNILSVYSSEYPALVDDMESYLIREFIFNPKCDNRKDGFTSHSDPMRDGAEKYFVYVVWNN